ncbi:MAG: DUF4352 domain-containing protein [Spirochaetia bacterium]|jgi:hypothetical protein
MNNKKIADFFLLAVVSTLVVGCLAMYGVSMYKLPSSPVQISPFELTIKKAQSDINATNYGIDVIVKNTSAEDATLDSGDFELLDVASGLSYYSISKDKESVSLPKGYERTITKTTVKAGRSISGMLFFVTGRGEAIAKQLRLIYKDITIDLKAE